jgi:hypothetical protein
MKASALVTLLGNFDDAAVVATGTKTRSGLGDFGCLFDGQGDKDVKKVVAALVEKKPKSAQVNSPAIRLLRETLTKIENCLRSAAANKAADDIAELQELLDGCGQANVGDFVREARGWLAGLTPADYVSRLKKLVRDNGQFDQTIEQLRADKKIKKPEMFVIAQGFLDRHELGKKIKTRDAALDEIVKWQLLDARREARGDNIGARQATPAQRKRA